MGDVRVVIYDSRIQAHFTPAGEVGKNAGSVGRMAEGLARGIAPVRTGELVASIRAGHQPGGRLYYNLFLNALAPHAKYVEHGTTGPIASSRPGGWLHLAPGNGYPALVKKTVAGQRGQHFLSRGMAGALRAHGYPVSAIELRRGQPVQNRL